jgi:phosphoribosylanthranilate isomerase
MTRVKICGITNQADAKVAVEAGADLLGFIFYPPSPRFVTVEQAGKVIQHAREASSEIRTVGVFVDEEAKVVRRIAERCGLDAVQLHGGEPPDAVEVLIEDGLDVFKAFRVRDRAFLADMERYRPTAYLLDTHVLNQPGGTGQTFDWELAVAAKALGPILLAGGLTPGNVAQAIRAVRPWGVDTASGVEDSPGQKGHDKVRRFIVAAKQVSLEGIVHPAQSIGGAGLTPALGNCDRNGYTE